MVFRWYTDGDPNKRNRVVIQDTCTEVLDSEYKNLITPPYPWYGVHMSWNASEDWFLANSTGPVTVANWSTGPTLTTYKLYQVFFDGSDFTYRELLSQVSSHQWQSGTNKVSNDHAHFKATIRSDGKQALFTSTNGVYTIEDWQKTGITPWGFEGFFLVDFVSVPGGPDTTAPSTPTNLQASAVSSSQICKMAVEKR